MIHGDGKQSLPLLIVACVCLHVSCVLYVCLCVLTVEGWGKAYNAKYTVPLVHTPSQLHLTPPLWRTKGLLGP